MEKGAERLAIETFLLRVLTRKCRVDGNEMVIGLEI